MPEGLVPRSFTGRRCRLRPATRIQTGKPAGPDCKTEPPSTNLHGFLTVQFRACYKIYCSEYFFLRDPG
jgi:hypothetical protein